MVTLSKMPQPLPVAPESEIAGGVARALLYREYRVVYEVIGAPRRRAPRPPLLDAAAGRAVSRARR
jgi:hypothetical protein